MIAVVAASIFVPRLFNQPKTDFVYSIDNTQVYAAPAANGAVQNVVTRVYYLQDVKKNVSRELSEAAFKKMSLDTNNASPDGFKVEAGGSGDSFFGSGSYRQEFLVGHGASYKLNIKLDQNDYSHEFKFLGWVK